MWGRNPKGNGQDAPAARAQRVSAVVAKLLATVDESGDLDVQAVIDQHPELMPELGRELDLMRRLARARRAADEHVSADTAAHEANFLRAALPDYQIVDEVHRGGQGVVYRAVQRSTNRTVALKVQIHGPLASDRERRRFEREAELIARLEHPNIVTLFESGVVENRPYYAMQFVDGVGVDDYVLLHDPTVREIVAIFVKVCRAVAYAHQNGVIHRDLHPGNVLIDERGEPRLLDFGLAKDAQSAPERSLTLVGQVFGVLPFLSPEQVGHEDGRADTRSDVYALAVILYVLLTEQFPYQVWGNFGTVREQIVSAEPLPLRKAFRDSDPERRARAVDATRELEAILQRALAKSKRDRYQSAAEFADDLENLLAGRPVAARATSQLYVLRKTLWRYRLPVTAASLVLIVSLVSTVVSLRALRNARAATAAAYQQFDLTLNTLEERVRILPGGVAVRDELLGKLAETLPELTARTSADSTLGPLATELLERRGDIAFNQGQFEEARALFAELVARRTQRWHSAPSPETAITFARAHRKAAAAAEDPIPAHEAALEHITAELKTIPRGSELALELAKLHQELVQRRDRARHRTEALHYADVALDQYVPETWAEVPVSLPADWRETTAMLLVDRGRLARFAGRVADSAADWQQARAIYEAMLAERPYDSQTRAHLAALTMTEGETCRVAGQFPEAIAMLRTAVDEFQQLVDLDPTVSRWFDNLGCAHTRLASSYEDVQQFDEATKSLARGRAIAERLASSPEATIEMRAKLCYVVSQEGSLLDSQKRYDEASAAYQRALAGFRELSAQDPTNAELERKVTTTLDLLSRAESRAGDHDAAIAHAREALDRYEREHAREPRQSERALDSIIGRLSYVAVLRRAGREEHFPVRQAEIERSRVALEENPDGISFAGREYYCAGLRRQIRNETRWLREVYPSSQPAATQPID